MWQSRPHQIGGTRSLQHHYGNLASDDARDDYDNRCPRIGSHL